MLRCAACGRRLIGDTGRYRHLEVCEAFAAAAPRPKRRVRGQHVELLGRSYSADDYEAIVREVLARIRLGADLLAAVMTDSPAQPEPDRLALSRIEREREAALGRYRRLRDVHELEVTMAQLDAQERALLAEPAAVLDHGERAAYLRDLPRLWDDAPRSRRALAEALFERIDVLGLRRVHLEPTASAIRWGLVEAFHARSGGYGRGERSGRRDNRLIVERRGVRSVVTMGGYLPPRLHEVVA
jgi:hypothetical protein